ncbi:MAG TPA: type 1 glutamine amidotransferase [Oceanithermus sp.]|nr:type 1 glutamine amidotransferase [Oceanithermus sp.]
MPRERGVFLYVLLVRFLLLQARNPEDPIRAEEPRQFAERLGVPRSAIATWDLLRGPPGARELAGFDALLVGGSGEYDVSKGNLPELEATLAFLRRVVEEGFPTFASCFGFQLLVAALGGEIVRDEAAAEVGTVRVCLTEEGRQDELFGALPSCFWVQAGHKDRAKRLPGGVLNLAYSEKAPFQALRVPGRPTWATQFHPELDEEDTYRRFKRYAAVYAPDLTEAEIRARLHPSPEANALLARFRRLLEGRGRLKPAL